MQAVTPKAPIRHGSGLFCRGLRNPLGIFPYFCYLCRLSGRQVRPRGNTPSLTARSKETLNLQSIWKKTDTTYLCPKTHTANSSRAKSTGHNAGRGDALLGHDGHNHGRDILGRGGIPRSQGGTGVRGRHTHRHHRRRRRHRPRQEEHAGTERHHTIHRRQLGRHRRRRHLHPAGTLYPRAGGALLSDIPLVAAGRRAGHSASDPLPQILRQGDARQIPLPRGYGYNRSARLGREGRRPSQTAGRGGSRGRCLRLYRQHLRRMDRSRIDTYMRVRRNVCRQVQGGILAQYGCRRTRPRIYYRFEVCGASSPRRRGRPHPQPNARSATCQCV